MTATVNDNKQDKVAGVGRVARVIGPVVDIEFPPDQVPPEIYSALHVDVDMGDHVRTMTLEVELQIGDNTVRAIAMKPTDGLRRGQEVRDTGSPITVPVGDVTKHHVWNVTGDVLNADPASLEITERWPIHRDPPPLRPAGVEDRDAGDRHQGARPADPRT